jgi:hypothetical protein
MHSILKMSGKERRNETGILYKERVDARNKRPWDMRYKKNARTN